MYEALIMKFFCCCRCGKIPYFMEWKSRYYGKNAKMASTKKYFGKWKNLLFPLRATIITYGIPKHVSH
jgi:hypothetical protein